MSITPEIIENRRKWVEALRSGNYTQARARLFGGDPGRPEYCCLGVAAEVCGIAWTDYMDAFATYGAEIPDGYKAARQGLGLPDTKQEQFIWLNDRELQNFNEIADYAVELFGENFDNDLEAQD